MSEGESCLLLRVEEAARLLGIGKTHLYKIINEGQIPTIRLGAKTVRISARSLREWVAEREGR